MTQIRAWAILTCFMAILKDIQTVHLVPIPEKHNMYHGNQQMHEFNNNRYIISQNPQHIEVLHQPPRTFFHTPHNTRTLNRYQLLPRYQPLNIHYDIEPKYKLETNILNRNAHNHMAPIFKAETRLLTRNPQTHVQQQFHSGAHMQMWKPHTSINPKNRGDFRYIPEYELNNLNRRRFEDRIDPTQQRDTPEEGFGLTRAEGSDARMLIRKEDFLKSVEPKSDSRISNPFQGEHLRLKEDNEAKSDSTKVDFKQDDESQYRISVVPDINDFKTDSAPTIPEANTYGVGRKVETQSEEEVPFRSDNDEEVIIPLRYVDNIDEEGKTESTGIEGKFEVISNERDYLKSEGRSDSAKRISDDIYVVTKDGDRHRTDVDFVETDLRDGIASVGKIPSNIMQADLNSERAEQILVPVKYEEDVSDKVESEANGGGGSEKYREVKTAELSDSAVENGKVGPEESDVSFKGDILDKSMAQNHYMDKIMSNNYNKGIEMKILESSIIADDKHVPMQHKHNTGEIEIESGISTDDWKGGLGHDTKKAHKDEKLHGSNDFGVPFQMTITGLLQLKPDHDNIRI